MEVFLHMRFGGLILGRAFFLGGGGVIIGILQYYDITAHEKVQQLLTLKNKVDIDRYHCLLACHPKKPEFLCCFWCFQSNHMRLFFFNFCVSV